MKLRFIKLTAICLFCGLIVSSCSGRRYYTESNLNDLSIGLQKNQLISTWGRKDRTLVPLIIRRASKVKDGELIEIGEIPLIAIGGGVTNYWFLFIDGTLKQWGKPRDWQGVKAHYEINYNPSTSVNY